MYLQGPFVAGFSSSNLGDSSPNILGPVCVNTGEKCDYLNSSCPIGGVSYYYKHAVYLGLQKVGKFPVNFGNFPEISETYREFWKVSGNLPEIFHPFATLCILHAGIFIFFGHIPFIKIFFCVIIEFAI